MANIEKKRLEKMEAEQLEMPPPPPKPRANKKQAEPEPVPETPEPVPEKTEPLPEKPVLTRQTNVIEIDEEKIASRVAEEVLRKIEQSKKPRKPRVARIPIVDPDPEPEPEPVARPRVVHNFSWL
jgi:hypothetical protein